MLGFFPNLTTEVLSRLPWQTNIENDKLWLSGAEVVHCDWIKGGDTNFVASSLQDPAHCLR